jgi:hypothetical protein
MSIRYQIIKARLLNELKYVGRISVTDIYDQERLVGRMLDLGSSLTKPDIIGVLKLLQTAVEKICTEGSRVVLEDFVSFTPTMVGTFSSESDGYSAPQNSIYITSRVSKVLNDRFVKNALVEKLLPTEKNPYFYRVKDFASGDINLGVTIGSIVTIYGERLKFAPENAGEYLRFVDSTDNTKFIEFNKFQKVTDKEIVIQLPQVTYPQGYFEIGSAMSGKTIRIGRSLDLSVSASA